MESLAIIPGYPNYSVTTDGRVWTAKRKTKSAAGWLSVRIDPEGYRYVRLLCDRRRYTARIARLVLMAYAGLPPTAKHQANHINGIKSDDRLCNLEWTTPTQNTHHSIVTGLVKGRVPRFVTVNDRRRPLSELCTEFKANYFIVYTRIFKGGWDPLRALTTPAKPRPQCMRRHEA